MIRPQAWAQIMRWAETGVVIIATWIAATLAWRAASRGYGVGAALGWGALAIVVVGGALWLRAAINRARLSGGGDATRVYAEESRILVIAPLGNLQIALDDIVRVAIADGRLWVLTQREGPPAVIPRDAGGGAPLADALSALPGFSASRAAAAMGAGQSGLVTIWRRDAGPELALLGQT